MGIRKIAAATLGALALTLAVAAQADAKDLVYPSVQLKKSNGYSGYVSAQEGNVTLSVSNKDGNASYTTTGKASAKAIKAKFKGFGKISLEFQPKGKPETNPPPDGCKGPKSETQAGLWVGKLTFKGENGYAKFDTKSAKGSVFTRPDKELDCDINPPQGGQKPCEFATGNLKTSQGALNVSGQAVEGKQPVFTVSLRSESNGVSVSKFTSADGGTLTVNNEAQTGRIAPPAPFKGDGDIMDGKLTGSLSVELFGSTLPLAGEEWFVSEGTCG